MRENKSARLLLVLLFLFCAVLLPFAGSGFFQIPTVDIPTVTGTDRGVVVRVKNDPSNPQINVRSGNAQDPVARQHPGCFGRGIRFDFVKNDDRSIRNTGLKEYHRKQHSCGQQIHCGSRQQYEDLFPGRCGAQIVLAGIFKFSLRFNKCPKGKKIQCKFSAFPCKQTADTGRKPEAEFFNFNSNALETMKCPNSCRNNITPKARINCKISIFISLSEINFTL